MQFQGLEPNIFPPSNVFSDIIKQEVGRLLPPSLSCATQVHQKLIEVVDKCDVDVSLFVIVLDN